MVGLSRVIRYHIACRDLEAVGDAGDNSTASIAQRVHITDKRYAGRATSFDGFTLFVGFRHSIAHRRGLESQAWQRSRSWWVMSNCKGAIRREKVSLEDRLPGLSL